MSFSPIRKRGFITVKKKEPKPVLPLEEQSRKLVLNLVEAVQCLLQFKTKYDTTLDKRSLKYKENSELAAFFTEPYLINIMDEQDVDVLLHRIYYLNQILLDVKAAFGERK